MYTQNIPWLRFPHLVGDVVDSDITDDFSGVGTKDSVQHKQVFRCITEMSRILLVGDLLYCCIVNFETCEKNVKIEGQC